MVREGPGREWEGIVAAQGERRNWEGIRAAGKMKS